MTYKCAIIGVSGGRANGHADAYIHIPRGQLACIATRNRANREAFGQRWNVDARYTDYREMFEREKPDLVHVNTPPNVRLEVMQAAEAAGVGVLIIEKPLAIQAEDYLAIRKFAESATVKVAINHQLHFHPRRSQLQDLVSDGAIGDVRLIDASARMNMAYQGTHVLQSVAAFHSQGEPVSIFAQISGANGLQEGRKQHYAPDATLATIRYRDGASTLLRCGTNGPYVLTGDERVNVHKQVTVYGTDGYVHWSMWGWETAIRGKHERGSHNYPDEDILGQAAMTEAAFDWLEDDSLSHPLNLDAALLDFHILLKAYMSGLNRREETLASDLQPRLIEALRLTLTS
ncbi:MAG: Gfo/Idh/MocA family oxidoreductase [Caldilineaceae bacterium]|nr:Gfo/Idh/MocA family oxidoreductase [Caldilineaceae bacterium]